MCLRRLSTPLSYGLRHSNVSPLLYMTYAGAAPVNPAPTQGGRGEANAQEVGAREYVRAVEEPALPLRRLHEPGLYQGHAGLRQLQECHQHSHAAAQGMWVGAVGQVRQLFFF
jgi:hypothetical protein